MKEKFNFRYNTNYIPIYHKSVKLVEVLHRELEQGKKSHNGVEISRFHTCEESALPFQPHLQQTIFKVFNMNICVDSTDIYPEIHP
jgi:hypothetical protein